MSKSQELYTRAKQLIPGGVQLLSKRPEMFTPDQWPNYAVRAKGCEVWDLDGNHYYDMISNGIGACLLGYADPDVTKAVVDRVQNGSMTSLNCPEEVLLAEKLIELHPWAENVRFARTGGETCAVAVRIARATTGRDMIAICGYHGWSDWYLACNLGETDALAGIHLAGLEPSGVPKGLRGSAVTFHHNNFEEFDEVIRQYGDRLAAVIMEPMRSAYPAPGFLEHIRDEIHRVGGLLIFDEISIGWRMTYGGVHKLFGVNPDIACFAKALGNGHPIGAVVGTRAAMDGAQKTFISSTYWTEAVGPTAALATIKKMGETRVWEHAEAMGKIVMKDWSEKAAKHGISITCDGIPCDADFSFDEYPKEMKTLYSALMLKEGFLGGTSIYTTLAHTEEIMNLYGEAIDRVFEKMAAALKKGGVEAIKEAIGGPVCQSGFQRLIR
jgi:glutamate-1-semialdehyde aminotransferase